MMRKFLSLLLVCTLFAAAPAGAETILCRNGASGQKNCSTPLLTANIPVIPLTKGGFGVDVSTGLTSNYVAYVSGGALVIGSLPVAAIASALAAGGNPIAGTILTASSYVVTPTIGTSAGAQHALPSGTAALLAADSTLDGGQLTNGSVTNAKLANSSVTLTQPAAGLTITGGGPLALGGTATFALADDLSAIEALSCTGGAYRTGVNTWACRTITAGTGIAITNGDGASGNPTIALTTPVAVANGGTGAATASANTIFAGPSSGSAAAPAFRSAVVKDHPNYTTIMYAVPRLPIHVNNSAVAPATTGLVAALAGNNASNSFTISAQPDYQRSLLFSCAAGWSGGDITVVGTDSSGSISETFTPVAGGGGIDTGHSWQTITSVSKSTVGGTAATCTAGPGNFLGIPTGGRPIGQESALEDSSGVYNGGSNSGVGVVYYFSSTSTAPTLNYISLLNNPATGDPSIRPGQLPDGVKAFMFIVPVYN